MELSGTWLGTLRMSDTLRAVRLDRLPWATWRVEVNARGQNILKSPMRSGRVLGIKEGRGRNFN